MALGGAAQADDTRAGVAGARLGQKRAIQYVWVDLYGQADVL